MKRNISLFFILLANIIILVHTVLPSLHCHHFLVMPFHSAIGSACKVLEDQDCQSKGQTCHYSHQHDGCGDNCQVSESFKLHILTKEKMFRNGWERFSSLEEAVLFEVFCFIVTSIFHQEEVILTWTDGDMFCPPVHLVLLHFLVRAGCLRSPTQTC